MLCMVYLLFYITILKNNTYVHVCMSVCVCMYGCVCMYVYVYAGMYVYIYAYMCVVGTKGSFRRDIKMIVNHDYIKQCIIFAKKILADYSILANIAYFPFN